MGYCYVTGKKVNGKWEFLKCDGRSKHCPQNPQPYHNMDLPARLACTEWCKRYKEAVEAVEEMDRIHKEVEETMNKSVEPKVGMRIIAYTPDIKKCLGKGVCIRVEPLTVEETGEVLTNHFPTFRLDNGKIIMGIDCWWCPEKKYLQEYE